MSSGIPQGGELGPILFISYINDLPDTVQNDAFLFADDTELSKSIGSVEDSTYLQQDSDKLLKWSNKWLLKFHPDKCKIITIGKRNYQKSMEFEHKRPTEQT